jgi:hypothetical protein
MLPQPNLFIVVIIRQNLRSIACEISVPTRPFSLIFRGNIQRRARMPAPQDATSDF